MENNGYNYNQPVYGERPMPSMMEATKACLRKYATFSGRARRSEYWWFYLATYIASIIFALVWVISMFIQLGIWSASDSFNSHEPMDMFLMNPGFWIYVLFMLAIILPGLAVTVRRLHDLGKSGWYLLVPFLCAMLPFASLLIAKYNQALFIPIFIIDYVMNLAVAIIFIIWMASNGKRETNKWGPSPKYFPIEQHFQPAPSAPAPETQE